MISKGSNRQILYSCLCPWRLLMPQQYKRTETFTPTRGPWNLFATLQTISSLWRIQRQSANADEIARRGGALIDKFTGFLSDITKIGSQIEGLQNTYAAARNKLSDGQGNLVRQAELLIELGAKNSKEIPADFTKSEATIEDSIREA
ncbi:DNA recombination protein RmuC [bacterium]|nr:DNA recombination protein RmuC [bacterium]